MRSIQAGFSRIAQALRVGKLNPRLSKVPTAHAKVPLSTSPLAEGLLKQGLLDVVEFKCKKLPPIRTRS